MVSSVVFRLLSGLVVFSIVATLVCIWEEVFALPSYFTIFLLIWDFNQQKSEKFGQGLWCRSREKDQALIDLYGVPGCRLA